MRAQRKASEKVLAAVEKIGLMLERNAVADAKIAVVC